jgi:hypothetical protein
MRLGATFQLEHLAPEPGDSAAVLTAKQHKLLFVQQVSSAVQTDMQCRHA